MNATAENRNQTESRVQLTGFVGQDIDLRELAQGQKLARLSVATNEFKRGSNGQLEKITYWHNLVAWGKLADEMNEKLRKGSKVFVEGRLVYRQYETKAGEKRNMTEIVVNTFRKIEKEELTEA